MKKRRLFRNPDSSIDRHIEAEVDEEIAFHLEMRTRDNLEAGMDDDEARREALRRFGEPGRIRRAGIGVRRHTQRARRGGWLEGLRRDIRFALRDMIKRPGITAVAIATLALGIGANTAMFSALNAVALRPLPYQDPEGIAYLWGWGIDDAAADPFVRMESIERFAFMTLHMVDVTGIPEPQRLRTMPVSRDFFAILGAEAARGRVLSADDHRPDAEPAVVVSHETWEHLLGADAAAIGETVALDGIGFTVIGVMPPGFRFLKYPDAVAWMPIEHVDANGGMAIARVAAEADIERVRVEATAYGDTLSPPAGRTNSYAAVRVESIREMVLGDASDLMWLLSGVVGLVLLIACVNVAQLLLSRLSERRREMAVRAALGASRRRLVRQMFTESGILALLGGFAGLGLAYWLLPAMLALTPNTALLPRIDEIVLDNVVLAVTLAVTVFTGMLFGAAPVVALGHSGLAGAMQPGGRTGSAPTSRKLRSGLVVAEIAIALIVVIGAGLFVRAFVAYWPWNPGFAYENRLTFAIDLRNHFEDDGGRSQFVARALDELQSMPGVVSAAAGTVLPMGRLADLRNVYLEPTAAERAGRALHSSVSADYFDIFELPVVRGRVFGEGEVAGDAVAVVNQTMARQLWPDADPLGQQVTEEILGLEGRRTHRVVGVVADARLATFDPEVRPAMWTSIEQSPSARLTVVLATREAPEGLVPAVRAKMRDLLPDLPLDQVETMESWIGQSVSFQRFNMVLMLAFGAVALALAAIGLFGVMSYTVASRIREIGVRMALGAKPAAVLSMLLREGALLIGLGVALGIAAALTTVRFVEGFIYDVEPYDPWTLASLTGFVAAVAMLACWVPALRATRADPVDALRSN